MQARFGAFPARHLQVDAKRGEERKISATAREDLEQGATGIQKAIGTLRNGYEPSFVQQSDTPDVHKNSGGIGASILEHFELLECGRPLS